VSKQGHRLKFFYATQVGQSPAIFRLYVNRDELFSPQYEKYLGDELRKAFGYEGCPIFIQAKPRPKTIDPVRNRRHRPFDANRDVRHGRILRPAIIREAPVEEREGMPKGKAARSAAPGKTFGKPGGKPSFKPAGKPAGKPVGKPVSKPSAFTNTGAPAKRPTKAPRPAGPMGIPTRAGSRTGKPMVGGRPGSGRARPLAGKTARPPAKLGGRSGGRAAQRRRR
jgi:hypothetical protein